MNARETAERSSIVAVSTLRPSSRACASVIPTDATQRAQELQLAIEHVVCDLVDRAIAGEPEPDE